jgi:drug/metabolite transporter (DMT)-like permease
VSARGSATNALPVLAVLGAVFLWASSFVSIKIALQAFHPFVLIWGRMLISALMFLAVLPRMDRPDYRPGDWRLLLLMAAFLPGLYYPLETVALTLTSASQAGMISATMPLLAAAGARLVFGERLKGRAYLGLAAAIGGVVWLTLAARIDAQSAPNPLLGNTLEMLAMCCSCGYVLTVKRLSARYGGWLLSGLQCAAGAVFFVPAVFFLEGTTSSPDFVPALLALLYLGGLVTLVAFGLYNYGLSRMPVSGAAAFINLIPVCSVLLGWAVLGETLTPGQYAASAVVMAGVVLSQGGTVARPPDSR